MVDNEQAIVQEAWAYIRDNVTIVGNTVVAHNGIESDANARVEKDSRESIRFVRPCSDSVSKTK